MTVWATITAYIAVCLFELGAFGPAALIWTVTGLTVVAVTPVVYRWANQPERTP